MEELLYTAEPVKNYRSLLLIFGTLVALLGFLFLVQTKKLKSITGPYRQISLLLGGMMALILLATAIFSTWHLQNIQTVKLYTTYMETAHGKTYYKEILRAGIFNDKEKSIINSEVVIREDNILVVERRDKRVLLFAEENYQLDTLVRKIRTQMEKR